jgi:hypothetical protein
MTLSREVEKLRLLAGPDGTVPAAALNVLAGARGAASAERWAIAVLAGDAGSARAESATLDLEGSAGTTSLWAIAERALAVLDPQPYGSYRRSGSAGPSLGPDAARRVLHAVYRADRALKRGEVRDSELRTFVEQELLGPAHA